MGQTDILAYLDGVLVIFSVSTCTPGALFTVFLLNLKKSKHEWSLMNYNKCDIPIIVFFEMQQDNLV